MKKFGVILLPMVLLGVPLHSRAGDKPIVAVFDIEARGVDLPADLLDRLCDYLSTRLTAAGKFQVVPRKQVRERLTGQKQESFRACYDQACQIEIGKELAAQKSLATQVLKLGSRCTVTSTLFDLRKSTTEKAASANGGCSEDLIVAALDQVVDQLTAEPGAAPVAPVPAGPTVSVDFESDPPGAEVFIDGLVRGKTPLRLELQKGRTHALLVEAPGYHPVQRRITVEGRKRHRYDLVITGEEIARRTEWITACIQTGGGVKSYFGVGAALKLATLKWKHIYWVILEGGGGGTDEYDFYGYGGTRIGYPLMLTASGFHQLRIGLGLGYYETKQNDPQFDEMVHFRGMYFSPNLRYVWQVSRSFSVGLEFYALLPSWSAEKRGDYAWALFLSVPVAWN
jgi:hypothetical protein